MSSTVFPLSIEGAGTEVTIDCTAVDAAGPGPDAAEIQGHSETKCAKKKKTELTYG